MYCTNCGVAVDENAIFCTRCGKRLKNEPVVTVAEQPAPEKTVEPAPVVTEQVAPPAAEKTTEPVVTVAEQAAAEAAAAKIPAFQKDFVPPTPAVDPSVSPAAEAEQTAPACTSFAPVDAQPPVMPFVPEKQAAEKVYFGKGALVFCLVVIGLLAISTGVFAGLYASLL